MLSILRGTSWKIIVQHQGKTLKTKHIGIHVGTAVIMKQFGSHIINLFDNVQQQKIGMQVKFQLMRL